MQPSLDLTPGSTEYFGVTEANLSDTLAPYLSQSNVKTTVKKFFSHYIAKEVSLELLKAFNTFLDSLKPHYEHQLEQLNVEKIEWTESDTVKTYLDKLSAWHDEEETLKKDKAAKSTGNLDQSKGDEHKSNKPKMRPKTALEAAFDSFHNAVAAEKEYWSKTVNPVNKLISNNNEYKNRFGPIPGSGIITSIKDKFKSHDPESIQQAKHLIKIYFVARSILEFNRDLYVYNAMMYEERGIDTVKLNFNINDNRFDSFLKWCTRSNIKTEGDECEVFMTTNGLSCSPFRLLLSRQLNVKLCLYRQVSFQTLQLVETQNPAAEQTETIWIKKNDSQPVSIHKRILLRLKALD